MLCTNLIKIEHENKPEPLLVPCGKCLSCLKSRSREWSLRINHEVPYWEYSYFITLTYEDENLLENKSLYKKHLQDFYKRLRKHFSIKIPSKKGYKTIYLPIKHFSCGEYGDKTQRPHYHAILFSKKLLTKIDLTRIWGKGLTDIGTVNMKSIQYVASYINKKLYGKLQKKIYTDTGRLPPFQLQSQGIGLKYALENKQRLTQTLVTLSNNNKCSLPRYYRKKLNLDYLAYRDINLKNRIKHSLNIKRKIHPIIWQNRSYRLQAKYILEESIRHQREATVEARSKLYEKKL